MAKYLKWIHKSELHTYYFISTKLIDQNELEVLNLDNKLIAVARSEEDAMILAADFLAGTENDDFVLSTDSVIPVSDWQVELKNELDVLDEATVVFGRYYSSVIGGRHFVTSENMGFKYIDLTPQLIANNIIDFAPTYLSHSIEVNYFPISFTWFSSRIKGEVCEALNTASCFEDFIDLSCKYLTLHSKRSKIFYSPNIETMDAQLLTIG